MISYREFLDTSNITLDCLKKWSETDRIAIINRDVQVTFREVAYRSDALAVYLLENYPGKEPVAIWCDKEADAVCSIYACMKSGHPYTVIASYYPEQRIKSILEVCHPCMIFAPSPIDFPTINYPIVTANNISEIVAAYDGRKVDYISQPSDVFSIIFTSGSTGMPKGVEITVKNLNYWTECWADEYLPVDRPGRVIDISNYSFVASFVNLFYAMGTKGATIYSVDSKMAADYSQLVNVVMDVNPNILSVTPNFLDLLLKDARFTQENLFDMTICCLGGESVTPSLSAEFIGRFPKTIFWNSYGCTESCAGIIGIEVTKDILEKYDRIPIGEVNKLNGLDILDDEDNPVAEGEIGEMILYGPQVSKGYYNNPANTARAYYPHASGYNAYRTKDLVFSKDGLIFYVGRKDNLVKVGGYRVELEEVEYHLRQVDIIKSCAVAPSEKEGRTLLLAAYVVLKDSSMSKLKAISHIRKTLGKKLQSYMVPQKVVILDALPANANGKIDRVKLKEMSKID